MGKVNPRFGQPRQPHAITRILTNDHKPSDKMESQRIEALGGSLSSKSKRVVWDRKKLQGGVYVLEKIPLLNIARSLGDLWSVTSNNQYLISPKPDVHVYTLDSQDMFIVVASDGLWNMLSAQEVVERVHKSGLSNIMAINEAAHSLIYQALHKWKNYGRRADNISVIICVFPNQRARHSEQLLRVKPASPTSRGNCIVPDLDFQSLFQHHSDEELFYS